MKAWKCGNTGKSFCEENLCLMVQSQSEEHVKSGGCVVKKPPNNINLILPISIRLSYTYEIYTVATCIGMCRILYRY